jgi:hypothetical protein
LIAFQCYRKAETGEVKEYWMTRGMHSISKMELWAKECKWNFENKLMWLNAERNYASANCPRRKRNIIMQCHLLITTVFFLRRLLLVSWLAVSIP